jgi:hypothetical protein
VSKNEFCNKCSEDSRKAKTTFWVGKKQYCSPQCGAYRAEKHAERERVFTDFIVPFLKAEEERKRIRAKFDVEGVQL